jgi:hypothetical protein
MPTELELSLLAAIAEDPSHRWSGLSSHASSEAVHLVSEVVDEVDDKDEDSVHNLLDQSEPESRQVVANSPVVEDAK